MQRRHLLLAGLCPALAEDKTYRIGICQLAPHPALDAAIQDVLAKYGSSNRNKYRAVIYYMLCVHFGKQAAYA